MFAARKMLFVAAFTLGALTGCEGLSQHPWLSQFHGSDCGCGERTTAQGCAPGEGPALIPVPAPPPPPQQRLVPVPNVQNAPPVPYTPQ